MMTSQEESPQIFDLETFRLSENDALKCLQNPSTVILPCPNVRACNNLNEYLLRSTSGLNRSQLNSSQPSSSKKRCFSNEPFAVPLVRNFDRILKTSTEVGSITTALSNKIRKLKPDVFSRADSMTGPLSLLKARMNETVKVLIRRRRKVPYISRIIEYRGTLVLFDKHMNLCLENVIESFTYADGDKIMKRARHRDNLIVRGDNVILVS